MSPTVQLKIKLSPGHVGGAATNCAATSPRERNGYHFWYLDKGGQLVPPSQDNTRMVEVLENPIYMFVFTISG